MTLEFLVIVVLVIYVALVLYSAVSIDSEYKKHSKLLNEDKKYDL